MIRYQLLLSTFAGYAPQFAQNAQRLSPQQQQQQNNPQQQQLAYLAQQQQQQTADGGRSNTPFGSQSGMQSPGMQNSPQQWPTAGGAAGVVAGGSGAVGAAAARSLQQHNNPLLIAQLQVSSKDANTIPKSFH